MLAVDNLVLTPFVTAWQGRSESIGDLRQKVARGQILLDRAEAMEGRWQQMNTTALSTDRSITENGILKSLARWARASHISFTSMRPQWKQPEAGYELLECRATASGNLNAIARFLYELETDPLAVKVDEVELAARDSGGQQLTMTLRFSGLKLPATKQ